jgi:flagellar motor switch protein FliN
MSRADKKAAKVTADEPEVDAADGANGPVGDASEGGNGPAGDASEGGNGPVGDASEGGNGPAADAPGGATQPQVSPIELAHLEPGDHTGSVGNLDLLRDIELSVTVEVGRARLRVRDLLALHEGSIVELDRPVGSPVDLLANGRAIARGEIVLVDDQLGIRVTAFNSDAEGD